MVDYSTPGILASAKNVLLAPARFYAGMPKSGGLSGPALFVVAMTVLAVFISALLSIPGEGFFAALKFFVVKSVLWSFCSLLWLALGSAVFFGIWKLLGASINYETAFRATGYAFAMLPVLVVLKLIPTLGLPAGILYTAWLLVAASVHAMGLGQGQAIAVFGVLSLLAIWNCGNCSDEAVALPAVEQASPAAKTGSGKLHESEAPVKFTPPAKRDDLDALKQKPQPADKASQALAMPDGNAALTYGRKDSANAATAEASSGAENAGRALGELVRDVGDMARNVGEEIAAGIESGIKEITPAKPDASRAVDQAGQSANVLRESAAAQQPESAVNEADASGLDAAAAGEAVGAIVRSIGDAAREAGKGFQSALQEKPAPSDADSVQQPAAERARDNSAAAGKAIADTHEKAVEKSAAATTPGDSAVSKSAGEQNKSLEQMTPEQLGAALGAFINRLNAAAEDAARGFEQSEHGTGANKNGADTTAGAAGEVLGRFLKGFNEAVIESPEKTAEQ